MKRCAKSGKIKHRDAGSAAKHIRRGYEMYLYRCEDCGFYHLTKRVRDELMR